jgi:pimeloyl-ACP methyl ester carboxylesterase
MPYFNTIDDTQLFYSVWGDGHPIVFVHGNNIGSDMWTFQIPHLTANGYQCISYDQRGFARSDCPRSGYDIDTLAHDLNCFLKHVNQPKVTVVAFSVGAGVLARYLSLYGTGNVDRVILISTVTPCFLKTEDNPEGMDREVAYEPFRAGLIRDRPQLLRDSLDAFFNPASAENPISEGIREWVLASAMQNPLIPMLEYARISSETDFRQDMRSFTIPTLIIHGDSDGVAPPSVTGFRTHKMIAQSEFVSYSGASHGLLFTHHDRLNRQIADFVAVRTNESDPSRRSLASQSGECLLKPVGRVAGRLEEV